MESNVAVIFPVRQKYALLGLGSCRLQASSKLIPTPSRVPSDPDHASVPLYFQLVRAFLELLCSCVRYRGRVSGIVACGMSSHLLQVKIVADTDKLAQASWSRLGEINRGSPKPFFHEWSPRRPIVILSERASRSNEMGLA
ncbi:hypothetical protein DEO72_LG6g1645 [Vigna unguiculata]|uniref:Uncharacterized protein n=1 Tax=Vigna unguiculata TaxID=3917 RepID=A0A4D6M6R5_VIGUN|nr:hypothetical protein DEO72_LG6g1645 [Vigna unguiculata]